MRAVLVRVKNDSKSSLINDDVFILIAIVKKISCQNTLTIQIQSWHFVILKNVLLLNSSQFYNFWKNDIKELQWKFFLIASKRKCDDSTNI